MTQRAEELCNYPSDNKLSKAISVLSDWTKGVQEIVDGVKQKVVYHPIVFCKYIQTAKYIGEKLKDYFGNKVQVVVATSELADEQRRDLIDSIHPDKPRILVATRLFK